MNIPRKKMRFCPSCGKHTEQKISIISSGHKSSSMKKGSKQRAKKRGLAKGKGNLGRYSRPPVAQHKRKTKSTKKTNLMFTCSVCKKSNLQRKGKRASKVVFDKE